MSKSYSILALEVLNVILEKLLLSLILRDQSNDSTEFLMI